MLVVVKKEDGEVSVVVGSSVFRAKRVKVYEDNYLRYDEGLPDFLVYETRKAAVYLKKDALELCVSTS